MHKTISPTMVVEIRTGTLEEKILRILLDRYPITVEEVTAMLKLSESASKREFSRLEAKGYIFLEPLPGKTFVRLMRMDFMFIGTRDSQNKSLKHKKSRNKHRIPPSDQTGMYG